VAANWNEIINLGRDARYYSYYALAKAMRLAVPEPVKNFASNGLDWYGDNVKGLARLLVNSQNSEGYWNYDGWPYVDPRTAAGWNVIILSRTLFVSGLPVAVAKANPNPVVVGQIVELNGADSFHQDASKTIDSWEWDLDNDGTYDVSGPFATVSFAALGDYPIVLRVTDDATPEESATTTVVVMVTTPPIAPTSDAGGPYSLCPQSQPWFLDGSGSTNPDEGRGEPGQPGDTIVAYEWDLDGDGQYDDALGAHPDVTAFFAAAGPGSYLIQLRVTDRTATSFPGSGYGDLSDTDSTVVVVRVESDPQCVCIGDLTVRAKPGKVQLVWTDTGAHHYNIDRGTLAGGPYLMIGATTSRYSTFLDTGVVNGSKYYYVVREADLLDRESCQSNEARALVPAVRK
jgi:hypothetical protein